MEYNVFDSRVAEYESWFVELKALKDDKGDFVAIQAKKLLEIKNCDLRQNEIISI